MTADKTARESNVETESSDILIANTSSDRDRTTTSATLYTRDISRQHRPTSRDRYECGRSCERGFRPERYERRRYSPYERDTRSDKYVRGDYGERDRRQNPLGTDGKPRKCIVCESTWHYVNNCPNALKLRDEYQKKKNDNKHNEKDCEVHLSW